VEHLAIFDVYVSRTIFKLHLKYLHVFIIVTSFPLLCCSHTHTHTHTCARAHTHTQLFYGSLDFVRDNLSEPVPEETCIHSHLSWSSVIPYLLPPSVTIHGILTVQFTCLIVFSTISVQVSFGLPLGLTPSTSYSIHFFSQSLSFFCSTCHTVTTCFAMILRLFHLILDSQPFTWNSILLLNTISDHSHLCPLNCRLIFLSYGPGLTSMQHTTLHTTTVQCLSHYQ